MRAHCTPYQPDKHSAWSWWKFWITLGGIGRQPWITFFLFGKIFMIGFVWGDRSNFGEIVAIFRLGSVKDKRINDMLVDVLGDDVSLHMQSACVAATFLSTFFRILQKTCYIHFIFFHFFFNSVAMMGWSLKIWKLIEICGIWAQYCVPDCMTCVRLKSHF